MALHQPFIFITPIAWDNSDGAHRPAQFARELARRGHPVTYVEIEKSRAPLQFSNPRVLNLEDLGWDELQVVRAWYGLDYAAPGWDVSATLLDAAPGVIIHSAPFRPALELVPPLAALGCALVYDALDDISEMRALGSYCYDDLAEQYLVAQAQLVVTLSPRLQAKFAAHPRVALIRDGVDLAPFADDGHAEAVPLLERGELTLGFWGTMWEYNLDLPLLRELSAARPRWQWHFIGAHDLDPARPPLARALAAPNVHFHPAVPRAQLAQYARVFDVCVLPTPVTPFNLARDPLKVYEYLACGKPVVATALSQLTGMPYVYLSRDAGEFLANVELAARTPLERARVQAYLAEQTWSKRTDALLGALQGITAARRALPPPARGAMPGAPSELERWQAYARHLERMVRDREAHVRDLERALEETSLKHKLKRALGG